MRFAKIRNSRTFTSVRFVNSITYSYESSDANDWLSNQINARDMKTFATPETLCRMETYAVMGNLNVAISRFTGRFLFTNSRFLSLV